MLAALRFQQDDPAETQAYIDQQLAQSDKGYQEKIKVIENKFDLKENAYQKEINDLQLDIERLTKLTNEFKLNIEKKDRECALKLQEALLKDRENELLIQLLKDEKEQLKTEVASLHTQIKDQGEINAIKQTRLEEKLKLRESMDVKNKSYENNQSVLSYNVPISNGFGRSQSPKVGQERNMRAQIKEQQKFIKELKWELEEKDNIINDLLLEKEELIMKIDSLDKDKTFLEQQVELIHKEKETSNQLLETQLRRKENEYMQAIQILDNEKENAKSMLSHLQNVIRSGDALDDSVVKKLNFSVWLNRNESNKFSRFHNQTTPSSPIKLNLASDEWKKILESGQKSSLKPTLKSRSRNPSNSGMRFVTNSIQISGGKNILNSDFFHTSRLGSLKQLSSMKNLHSTAVNHVLHDRELNNINASRELNWFEENIDGNQLDNIITLDSSDNNKYNSKNPYKRSSKSKSKTGNTSEGEKGIQQISDIRQSSKEHSDDVNGTLMNSIVNLFPNKFKHKKSNCSARNLLNNPVSSFCSSPENSLLKEDMILRNRNAKQFESQEYIKEFKSYRNEADECINESPNSSAQIPYGSHHQNIVINPSKKIIDNKTYIEMLETGKIMKNINGDVLWKKWNREFTIEQLITDINHWKRCLKQAPSINKVRRAINDDPNCQLSLMDSDEEESSSNDYRLNYTDADIKPNDILNDSEKINNNSILLMNNDEEQNSDYEPINENDNEQEGDNEGEYDEDIEEGIPCESEGEFCYQQQTNNRYACPQVILETVEQESEEWKSSEYESANYISQPKIFPKNQQVSKPPSMRYFSQGNRSEGNNLMNSVQVKDQQLNQSPFHASIKHEMSQQMINSPLNKKNSKYSQSPISNKNNNSVNGVNEPSEISVRLFKDITHKMHPTNTVADAEKKVSPYQQHKPAPKESHKTKKSKNVKNYNMKKTGKVPQTKIVFWENLNDLNDWYENEPIGYARINLMNYQPEESDNDSIPFDKINSKLSKIENAVQFFYEKMSDNYHHWMNEVGTLKDYIEFKSEKKAKNSRVQSIYSNIPSAMKTPVQNNKFYEVNMSSRKNTPLLNDGNVITGMSSSNLKWRISSRNQINQSRELIMENGDYMYPKNLRCPDLYRNEDTIEINKLKNIINDKKTDLTKEYQETIVVIKIQDQLWHTIIM